MSQDLETNASARSNVTNQNNNNLNIDNVVSSHPELGPTPPDGGYGWVILFSAAMTQIMIPSTVSAYGILILYMNLVEGYEENEVFKIWENNLFLVPVLTTVFWLLLEPWSRTMVLLTNRPRAVSISGVFLMSAGILLSNFAVESEGSDIIINVFAAMFLGIGASLTNQQAEILLHHYFRKRLPIIRLIFRLSILIGNILIPLFIGFLCLFYNTSTTIVIYGAVIAQLSFMTLCFTRPTYITQALSSNYKILKEEAADDEDETIYSSQLHIGPATLRQTEDSTNNNGKMSHEAHVENMDDDQDEDVIGTFNASNTTREVVQPNSPVLVRYETASNPFGSNFEDMDQIDRFEEAPGALYRETTVANDVNSDYIFTFDPPKQNPGTERRTADTKKNVFILLTVLKDMKFHSYTITMLSYRFSMLIFGVLFPAFLSQQLPELELFTVVIIVTVVHIGSLCLTIIAAITSLVCSYKNIVRICSILAIAGFIALSDSSSKSWLTIWGVVAMFATNSIYVTLKPIHDKTSMEFDSTAISIMSNVINAMIILLIIMVYNYDYATCFKIAASFHVLIPFVSFYF